MRLYEELTLDLQEKKWQLKANHEKARELADMVGSVLVDDSLPLEILGLVADCLKEDLKQIKQAAVDIEEEQQAIKRMAAGKE